MKSVYVVMKTRKSTTLDCPDTPHEVYLTKKAAKQRMEELRKKAKMNVYWYEAVPMVER